MKKLFFQLLLLASLFIGLWYGLNAIDWMKIFHVKKMTSETEKKLGELCWKTFKKEETEIDNKRINRMLDSILNRICESNHFDRNSIKLHIVKSEEINAFALPGNHLVVYSGLISAAENESEIAGVISHELAHMQSNHVMKKMMNEVGLTAIISITSSGTGGEIIKKAAKTLSSSAYSRSLETEADEKGTDYLMKASFDPSAYADFFTKIDSLQSIQIPDWISSHPDSKERASHIKQYVKGKNNKYIPVTNPQTLEAVKEELGIYF
jgi:predicted Zn-dependent protease